MEKFVIRTIKTSAGLAVQKKATDRSAKIAGLAAGRTMAQQGHQNRMGI